MSSLDTFLLLNGVVVILVDLEHNDVVLYLVFLFGVLSAVSLDVLTGYEDEQFACQLVRAHIHTYW